jgi:Secretion system C-terminal sorting domain
VLIFKQKKTSMKKITLLLSLVFVFPCLAQSNEIYGIARNNNPDVTYLAKVNTTNGLIQDISTTSYSPSLANFSFTVDPLLGIYYYSGVDTFIGLDMNTGELVYENPITTSLEPIFQYFIYNEITQEIIGIERGGIESGVYLSKIDPTTGIVTPISANAFANTNTITIGGAAIDMVNQWYHIFSDGRILSVDIETGNIVHDPIVDTSEYENFNNLIYNPADRNLYSIGRNSNPNELFFVQMDPITGAVTTISPTSIGEALELEGSALDPFSNIYYFKRPNPTTLVAIDVTTGMEVNATPFDFSASNGAYFEYFYFGGETSSLLLSNDEFSDKPFVNIYPNPTNDILHVAGSNISRTIVYTITGQEIDDFESINAGAEDIKLDVSGYKAGIYFVKVFNEQMEAVTLKFLKE